MASQHVLPLILGATFGLLAGCDGRPAATPATAAVQREVNQMEIVELAPGSGIAVAAGQKALVHYTGWLYETAAADKRGKEFDSSKNSGKPFGFTVGAGQVIKGWDQGVLGMKVGGKRRLTIPANLGYGDVGAGNVIPPGATLIFDVDLIAIE